MVYGLLFSLKISGGTDMDPVLAIGGIMAGTILLLIFLLIGQTKKAAQATALLKLARDALSAYQKAHNVRSDDNLSDDEWVQNLRAD